jgi:hypothetical protein
MMENKRTLPLTEIGKQAVKPNNRQNDSCHSARQLHRAGVISSRQVEKYNMQNYEKSYKL